MPIRRHSGHKVRKTRMRFWRSGPTTEIVVEGTTAVVILGLLLGLCYIAHLFH